MRPFRRHPRRPPRVRFDRRRRPSVRYRKPSSACEGVCDNCRKHIAALAYVRRVRMVRQAAIDERMGIVMVLEAHKIRMLEELKGRTLKKLLHEKARSREPLTIVMEEGESVIIEPASQLKPLPRLECRVPEGWKDAV